MLALAAAPRNSLRELRSLRSNSRGESVHEARCARGRKHCASRLRTGAPPPARAHLCRTRCLPSSGNTQRWISRQAAPAGGDFWGAEKRSARVGARSALRAL